MFSICLKLFCLKMCPYHRRSVTSAVQTAPSVSSGATGFKEFPTHNKRSMVKKKGVRLWTQTRTCSQRASYSRTDDSQMFLWRYCDSHNRVWCGGTIELGYPANAIFRIGLKFPSHFPGMLHHTWTYAVLLREIP